MGMGYAACSIDVISSDGLSKLCKDTYKAFIDALGAINEDIDAFAQRERFDDFDDDQEHWQLVIDAWDSVCKSFHASTGLDLYIGYHDSDNDGCRYDDVDGHFFSVDGMYELTEAGARIHKYVTRSHFVQFG